jgi:cytoskeletal protein RodZ
LHKPHHVDSLRLRPVLALAALMLALFVPAVASAQDPAGDQYAPTEPSGGTGSPGTSNQDPVQTSSPSNDGAPAADTSASAPVTADAPTATTPAATTADPSVNKRQRTLDQIAADATQQRQQRAASAGENGATTTTGEQLSAEPASGSGMGTYLLIALGLVLLWAVVAGIVNFRRRRDPVADGRTAGEDGKRGQPA